MSQSDPIIIIGAGHNGLACAASLAKSGKRVLVLERKSQPGGIAATETLFPGFRFNTGFANVAALDPRALDQLDLSAHGLRFIRPQTAVFAARPGGGGLAFDGAGRTTLMGPWPETAQDIDRLPEFCTFLASLAGVLQAMTGLTPPPLKGPWTIKELWPWARVALQVKGLGRREMMEFLRVLPMSASELLGEWFTSDPVKGTLALFSTISASLGPMGSGTALNLIYHFLGGFAPVFAEGGAGELSAALAKSVQAAGGEIRLGAAVTAIQIEAGPATGVRTQDGFIPASCVVSSADPYTTLNSLTGVRHLPVRFARRLSNIRFRGTTATVHFALDRLPDFGVESRFLDGWIAMAPSLNDVERAYDAAKYGGLADHPALLATIPSLSDPSLAPAGKHTLSAVVRYAPYHHKTGDWSGLADKVTAEIARFAPGFEACVLSARAISPHDYAQDYGLTEGAWTHGQQGLDQMLVGRPLPGWAGYNTPIKSLYLCGSGSHPGGGITAAPGLNAAQAILQLKN